MSDLIARTFARAGSSIRAHALRHLAATELLAATGGDIAVVAEQLGHRNIGTTAGYAKVDRGRIAAALDRLQAERLRAPAAPTTPRHCDRPRTESPPRGIAAVPSPPPTVDDDDQAAEQIAAAKAAWAMRPEAEPQPRHRSVTRW